ncbi:hypothetical protein [Novosphingobium guangzhouense]|uniref:Uncharacterized protein n=1 Tax=Novosphingobium guangzhouense TaxID=1850347 RepID=A0A2K2FUQ9_9SPHN|nr:hypothetical protein [Novosphingobium guangzhouense]PNU02527.1 hypothetical protein A8V01_09105 [Novosphingobium guangzhouense]
MPIQTLYAARNIDFAPTLNFDYRGEALPLDGATISMQVRLYPGAAGDPLVADAAIEFEDAAHPRASEPEYADWRRLTVFPVIEKAALAAMPGQNQPDPGDAQTFAQEIKITYADAMQDSLLSGEFVLYAGVDAT